MQARSEPKSAETRPLKRHGPDTSLLMSGERQHLSVSLPLSADSAERAQVGDREQFQRACSIDAGCIVFATWHVPDLIAAFCEMLPGDLVIQNDGPATLQLHCQADLLE